MSIQQLRASGGISMFQLLVQSFGSLPWNFTKITRYIVFVCLKTVLPLLLQQHSLRLALHGLILFIYVCRVHAFPSDSL